MGLETLLILIGVTFKWVLHPNVVNNQQALGNWCLYIGLGILAVEVFLMLCVLIIGAFGTSRRVRRFK